MIKLNNKNITYVALADSNNSLKAPKEIWYADSSNSVKLVYRRKDALIEGEDYEKYHWLVGDADAYINTLKYYRPYDDSVQMTVRDNLYPNRESKTNKYNVEEQIWGACSHNYVQSIIRSYIAGTQQQRIANNIINATTTGGDVNWAAYNVQSNINENQEHSLYISSVNDEDEYYFIYNGNTKDKLPTRYTLPELVQQDVRIFRSGLLNNDYFNGSFFNFIHYRNNVEITHLIPCKLLKPVPKWLDANGIRRQAGECGMIDLVSGKFYGNVNSVGTFTVENYYERKEWLVGDGEAYIDTNVIVNASTLKLELQYKLGNESFQPIFGSRDNVQYESQNTVLWVTDYTKFRLDLLSEGSSVQSCNALVINSIEFDATVPKVTINGSEFTSNKSFTNSVNTFRIFDLYFRDATHKYADGSMSYFKLNDGTSKFDLIPCTLTMDLPASMDANNIARTKGTSGMWDLVSDKFYGNVANSGTFKAVNLAEGVDYEVHQWLQGDGTAYIEGIHYNLWDNHIVLQIGKIQNPRSIMFYSGGTDKGRLHIMVNTDTGQSEPYLMVSFRELDSPATHIADIRPFSSMPDTVDMDFYISNSTFYCKQNEVIKTNNPSHTAIESTWSSITPKIQSSKISYIREVLPNGTYNSNLIPCRLLRPIPSTYDANGIARQAGECGMYDTVNDVFYGNVASSGSFTVSDDN